MNNLDTLKKQRKHLIASINTATEFTDKIPSGLEAQLRKLDRDIAMLNSSLKEKMELLERMKDDVYQLETLIIAQAVNEGVLENSYTPAKPFRDIALELVQNHCFNS